MIWEKHKIEQDLQQLQNDKLRIENVISSSRAHIIEGTDILEKIDESIRTINALLQDGLYDE